MIIDLCQMLDSFFQVDIDTAENFLDIVALYPFVNKLVLFEDIHIYARMFGVDATDFRNGPAALPYLHPFRRHIDCEGTLRMYFQVFRTVPALPHFCDKGKLFPRTVEFGVTKFLQCMRIEMDILADPAILYNKIKA